MERIITVRGVGTAKTKPDWVRLSLNLNAKDKDYEAAMNLASEQIASLNAALETVGFKKGKLKTVNFNVNTEYEGVHDGNGNYRNVFAGYCVYHALSLEFKLDNELLSKTLTAIASADAKPELNIAFTVKDPTSIKEQLLKNAAENAKAKAEILAASSGVRLGQLINIDYNWGQVNVFSNTNFAAPKMMRNAVQSNAMFEEDFAPEEISSSDSAAFTWELTD